MRGTPFRRTILTWACILSLTFTGCAANRSTIPPDASPSKTIHALAVIPWEDVPEFNVVRMGNSRMVGALRGAGRGFFNGAAAVAQGIAHGSAGLQGGSGGSDAVVLAVFAAVMLSVGAVNAVIEGVKGSWAGAPYEKVSDPDDATKRRLASLRIQEGFARLMKEEARKRLPVPILPDDLPARNDGDGARILRELNDSGIDAALRVGIARVAFEGRDGKDRPLSVVVTLRAEIVRTMDGARIFETTLEHRSAEIPPEEWAKDDFLRLVQELDVGVRGLAKRCVDDILGAGLVLLL